MTRPDTPRPPALDGPKAVSRFEFNLIRLARFAVGQFPADVGLQHLKAALARPDCLSPTAVHLVRDTLSKGCVLFLVRAGGWRNERYLRAGKPTPGRVWDRVPLDERVLEFSSHVLDFLMWATAEKVHESKTPWDAPAAELTPADELFFALAFDACRSDPDVAATLGGKQAVRKNPLARLAYPGELADADEPTPPAFAPLFEGVRAVMLECLQPYLAGRRTRNERVKGQVGDWKRMRQQGRAEYAALRAFLAAAETANRPDLARFLLRTNAALFQTDLTPVFWTGGLQGSGPPRLAERLDTQRAALAVPRQMDVLEGWQQRARSVGYFDEEYAASQMWKADWEAANGDAVAAPRRQAVEMLEPLRGPSDMTNAPPMPPQ